MCSHCTETDINTHSNRVLYPFHRCLCRSWCLSWCQAVWIHRNCDVALLSLSVNKPLIYLISEKLPCAPMPCGTGGVCVNLQRTGFRCDCLPSYSGDNCTSNSLTTGVTFSRAQYSTTPLRANVNICPIPVTLGCAAKWCTVLFRDVHRRVFRLWTPLMGTGKWALWRSEWVAYTFCPSM